MFVFLLFFFLGLLIALVGNFKKTFSFLELKLFTELAGLLLDNDGEDDDGDDEDDDEDDDEEVSGLCKVRDSLSS